MNIQYEIKRIDFSQTDIVIIKNLNDVLRFVESNTNPYVIYKITVIESERRDVTDDVYNIILGR